MNSLNREKPISERLTNLLLIVGGTIAYLAFAIGTMLSALSIIPYELIK